MRDTKRDYKEVPGVPETSDAEQIRVALRADNRFLQRPPRMLGQVELDRLEAARGASRELQIADEDVCAACDGSGVAPGSEVQVCDTCLGKGTVRASAGLGIGRWLKVEPCPACEGEGRFQTPCPHCQGRGELRRERTIKVRVPAGVESGTRLRVAGEDENAYLIVRLKALPRDSATVRLISLALLVCAVALLAYLVVWA